jgi:hypothetical protein
MRCKADSNRNKRRNRCKAFYRKQEAQEAQEANRKEASAVR